MSARRRKKGKGSRTRKIAYAALAALFAFAAAFAFTAVWFVHHPKAWLDERKESWPGFLTTSLFWAGNGLGDVTDALDITGHDAVYEYDVEYERRFRQSVLEQLTPTPIIIALIILIALIVSLTR